MKCPACNIDIDCMEDIMFFDWIDAQINNLKVKCSMFSVNESLDDEIMANDNEQDEVNENIAMVEEEKMIAGKKRKKKFNMAIINKKRKFNDKKSACNWIGTYGEFNKHQEECKYKWSKCNYCKLFGTFDNIQLQNMDDHFKECKYFPIVCQDCGEPMQRRNLDEHLAKECVKGIVICNKCEEVFIREEIEQHKQICPKEFITCSWINYGCVAVFEREK